MGIVSGLIPALERQAELYLRLGGLLDEEEEALVTLSLDEIRRITHEKDTLLLKIKVVDETRLRIIAPLASELGRSTSEVTARDILGAASPAHRADLDRVIAKLEKAASAVLEKNRRNDRLLASSQAAMQESYALLAALAGGGVTYGADGSLAARSRAGAVVAREA
jgi:flagellar biosynthesis/type III secretory pathway chaperone